jgi:hypothetical protein
MHCPMGSQSGSISMHTPAVLLRSTPSEKTQRKNQLVREKEGEERDREGERERERERERRKPVGRSCKTVPRCMML